MLGALGNRSSSPSNDRVFVYEVTGLRQNDDNDGNDFDFRSSGNIFIRVPYDRMNEEMQRIVKMGGSIVNISPVGAASENKASSAPEKKASKAKAKSE